MPDRASVLQIKLSNTKKCSYNIKEAYSKFKNRVSSKVQQNGESYKCLPILKITIKREFIPYPKHIIIINVYAPTIQLFRNDVSVLDNFYKDASTVLNEVKNESLVFSSEDWNAKLGKNIKHHASDKCIGSFARDVQTNIGQHPVDFYAINNLFISNTFFQHKTAHITTWENKRVHPKNVTKTITVYDQIDYKLSRSSTRTEPSNDHYLVICKLQVEKIGLLQKCKQNTHQEL